MREFPRNFWFTRQTPVPCFWSDSALLPSAPVTHNPSRKQFFARMFGAAAALGVFSKLFAKAAVPRVAASGQPAESVKTDSMPVAVRVEKRAVARRDGAA